MCPLPRWPSCAHSSSLRAAHEIARRPRCPPAQPSGLHARAAPRRLHRADRPFGIGEVVPRLRHHLRRGPAPLHRIAVHLRQAVPRAHAAAGRGFHRGYRAGRGDRAEEPDHVEPLHRRHRHRDLRLPASAMVPDRTGALRRLRRRGALRHRAGGGGPPGRARRRTADRVPPAAGGARHPPAAGGEPAGHGIRADPAGRTGAREHRRTGDAAGGAAAGGQPRPRGRRPGRRGPGRGHHRQCGAARRLAGHGFLPGRRHGRRRAG